MMKRVEHGMYLDGKSVMDDALSRLHDLKDLIPVRLHDAYEAILYVFQHDLAECDVSKEGVFMRREDWAAFLKEIEHGDEAHRQWLRDAFAKKWKELS